MNMRIDTSFSLPNPSITFPLAEQDACLWICWQWQFGAVVAWWCRACQSSNMGYSDEDCCWNCKRVWYSAIFIYILFLRCLCLSQLCMPFSFRLLLDYPIVQYCLTNWPMRVSEHAFRLWDVILDMFCLVIGSCLKNRYRNLSSKASMLKCQ